MTRPLRTGNVRHIVTCRKHLLVCPESNAHRYFTGWKKILLGRTKMSSHSKLLVIGLILQISIGVVAAQSKPAGASERTTRVYKMPFIAEVVGTDVNVRSGAGTAYYDTGKVNAPGRVTVVGEKTGWYEIIPPLGSFSWIAKEFVDVNPTNPGIGMVKDAGVRIWAGSDYREPIRSSILQVKLNKGDIVKLIGTNSQESDYYKIVPPPGAHLWISGNYLKYVEAISRPSPDFLIKPKPKPKPVVPPAALPVVPPVVAPKVDTIVVEPTGTKPSAGDPPAVSVTVVEDGSVEKRRVDECYALARQIAEELKKPLEAQDYDEYTRALTVILNDPQAGKAVRYAKYQLGQIKRFELAQQADQDVKKQDSALARLRQEIKEKYAARLAGIPNPGKYIIKGTIQPSLVYTGQLGQKRYKILNETGKIICYAVPAASASATNMDDFIGRSIGLKGRIVTDKSNPVGLVTFTAIEQLAAVPQNTNEPGI